VYIAWDRAREDYRYIRKSWSKYPHKEHFLALRDAEHFLFRYWITSQEITYPGVRVGRFRHGVAETPEDLWTDDLRVSKEEMEYLHDPMYNASRRMADSVFDIAPTTQQMLEWERRGYEYGKYAAKQNKDRNAAPNRDALASFDNSVSSPIKARIYEQLQSSVDPKPVDTNRAHSANKRDYLKTSLIPKAYESSSQAKWVPEKQAFYISNKYQQRSSVARWVPEKQAFYISNKFK
jgi:hypothetical protein